MRKCIGCNESKDKNELIRIAYYDGALSIDMTGRAKGRGVYICRNLKCMEQAKKKNGLQRSFKTGLSQESVDEIFEKLEETLK